MTEKLEKLIQKENDIFNSKDRKVNALPVGNPVVLRGPAVGYEIINEIDSYRPGTSLILKNKPEEADAYCELDRWNSEWDADSSIPCIKIQYYKILERT